MPAKPIPDGYEGATPYICCKDAASALDFYKAAFGAKELMRMPMPGGKIAHAEIQIGGARIMLSDEFPDWGCLSPLSIGGSATSVMIYFEDVDPFVERAPGRRPGRNGLSAVSAAQGQGLSNAEMLKC